MNKTITYDIDDLDVIYVADDEDTRQCGIEHPRLLWNYCIKSGPHDTHEDLDGNEWRGHP